MVFTLRQEFDMTLQDLGFIFHIYLVIYFNLLLSTTLKVYFFLCFQRIPNQTNVENKKKLKNNIAVLLSGNITKIFDLVIAVVSFYHNQIAVRTRGRLKYWRIGCL